MQPLTNGELIDILQKYDRKFLTYVGCDDGYYGGYLYRNGVTVENGSKGQMICFEGDPWQDRHNAKEKGPRAVWADEGGKRK